MDDDRRLLEEFIKTGSQTAFAQLVQRHLDLVYAACRRQLRDTHLAEDAAQAVFIILARKANSISRSANLTGWLYNTARLVCANAQRLEKIRRRHEMNAADLARQSQSSSSTFQPPLDDALLSLAQSDRDPILMHYIQGTPMSQVAASLGITEAAARKRLSRGIERLRKLLATDGGLLEVGAVAAILSASVESAPAALAPAVVGAAFTGTASAAASSAAIIAKGVIAMAAVSKAKAITLAAVLILMVGSTATLVVYEALKPPKEHTIAPAPPVNNNPPVVVEKTAPAISGVSTAFQHHLPEYAAFPYAKGFPLVLPGSITGSPVLLDLDGDGKLEIAVPCIGRLTNDPNPNRYERSLHPNPSLAGQIYAFRTDGSPYPNYPIIIRDPSFRSVPNRYKLDWYWNFSPSVVDADKNGTDDLVVGGSVLYGDGVIQRFRDSHDPYGSVALADIDGDGDLDMLMGWTAQSVRGSTIRGWPRDHSFPPGFSPAVGDADGDGTIEIYHPNGASDKKFSGYDQRLRDLPGWPKPMDQPTMYPVMGDMDGDGKAEIAVVDLLGMWNGTNRLHIWHHDGTPLVAAKRITAPDGVILDSVFKTGLYAYFTHPAMADLDGDGSAEILILDWFTRSVRAWKADGSPAVPHDPSLPDGHLLSLPPQRTSGYGAGGGISVADLGGDGIIDIFVGTTWFQLSRDKKSVRAIDMMPGHPQCTVTPTIADLDSDGLADIIFGTTDGRLFVYQTGKGIRHEWVEWAMQENNARHTAMWIPRKLRTGR